jgi:L-alanine-DL-glutamate epimerase-like enolase superfamily enzyme
MRHDLTVEQLEAQDGWMTVPDRPGLGVTLNEDFVKEYLVAESGK